MPKKIIYLLLFFVALGGFFLRVYNNTGDPPGLFSDEASIGYNAYTLLQKGTDESGNYFPALFASYNQTFYRPGVSIYITSLFVYIFGLKVMSLRLASAIIGTITLPVLFYITVMLFSSLEAGLLSAFLLAISPWHIHMSRIDQEFVYLPFFLLSATLLFLLYIKKKHSYFFPGSMFLFGVALYTYVPAYFVVPVFITLLFLLYGKRFFPLRANFFIGICIFAMMTIPLVSGIQNGRTLSRFYNVSGANQGKTTSEVAAQIVYTYLDHFSPEFLFEKGDIGYHGHFITRFSVKGMGELYYFQLPLIIFGLVYAYKKNKKSFWFLVGWLLIYPLSTSLLAPVADGGGPFASRSIIGVIPFQILSALGISLLYNYSKPKSGKYILLLVLFAIIGFSIKDYLYRYFVAYPLYAADYWGWQYGPGEIIPYFVEQQNKYDDEIMQPEFNSAEIFFKFYAPNNCAKCRTGTPDYSFDPTHRQLFAVTPLYLQQHPEFTLQVQKQVLYPNGTIAFLIGEVTKN